MISLHRSMHSSQMYTPGPAMSLRTCFWLFPQKEHFSRSPPSPIRAMSPLDPLCCGPRGTPLSRHVSLSRMKLHDHADVTCWTCASRRFRRHDTEATTTLGAEVTAGRLRSPCSAYPAA